MSHWLSIFNALLFVITQHITPCIFKSFSHNFVYFQSQYHNWFNYLIYQCISFSNLFIPNSFSNSNILSSTEHEPSATTPTSPLSLATTKYNSSVFDPISPSHPVEVQDPQSNHIIKDSRSEKFKIPVCWLLSVQREVRLTSKQRVNSPSLSYKKLHGTCNDAPSSSAASSSLQSKQQ